MGKVIFIDIDGTLLDYENKLPASADRAIKEARKNGHRVYICTGRSEVEVYDYIWDIVSAAHWIVEVLPVVRRMDKYMSLDFALLYPPNLYNSWICEGNNMYSYLYLLYCFR